MCQRIQNCLRTLDICTMSRHGMKQSAPGTPAFLLLCSPLCFLLVDFVLRSVYNGFILSDWWCYPMLKKHPALSAFLLIVLLCAGLIYMPSYKSPYVKPTPVPMSLFEDTWNGFLDHYRSKPTPAPTAAPLPTRGKTSTQLLKEGVIAWKNAPHPTPTPTPTPTSNVVTTWKEILERGRDSSGSTNSATPRPASKQETHYYVGNKRSKIFHEPSCPSVDQMSYSNMVSFDSRDDAIDSGYRPCQRCYP